MMRTVLGLLLLGGVLMGLITEETLAAETTPAPVWPAGGTHFIPKSYKQPPLDDPDHALWRQARLLGPLCANGQPEAPDSRSDVRLLFHDGTLWVRARCLDPAPAKIGHGDDPEEIWQGDSIEMRFSEREDAAFPLLHVQVSAGGLLRVVRYLRPFAPWGDPLLENPDPSQIKVRAKVDTRGWWVILGIPVEFYRIGQPTFQANVTRNRLGKPTGHAWVDLFNGRFQRPSRLGHMTMTEDPPKTRPALALPGGLAVGVNRLKVSNAGPGTVLRFGDKTLPVSREGTVSVEVSRHGHVEMALVAGKGQSDLRYGAEVRRPLIVDAVKPFQEDAKAPIDVKIALCTASEAPVVVTLEGFAGKERVARKTLKLTNGTHDVQLTHTLEAPGEVRLVVRAEVPTGGKPLAVEAYHWCVLGKPAEAFDHFRKGIDDLPTRSLLRAGLADAVTYFRLIQTGEGIYANRPGSKRAREWNRCFVYVPALLYKADWPENPHRGDKRLLESARLGLEREVDPALWQHFMTFPPNRDLQPALLAYGLIKDDVPPEQAAYLRRSLERIVEAVVETWITPAEDLYTFYSRDVGTGTNHWAYHVANVYTAGKVLDRPEWVALGQKMMLRLAKHEQDGQFPERRGTPASTYTWLTINALGEYYRQSGDESVKETLMRCARW